MTSSTADLTITLSRPRMELRDGARRPVAEMRIVCSPEGAGSRGAATERACFEAPLGPIEAEDLRWYLEEYPHWPFGLRAERAKRTEADLPTWGKRLFDATLGAASPTEALRQITVNVEDRGSTENEAHHHEAAARLLGLPWELLHDGKGYLFEGARGARVRRSLASAQAISEAPATALPLRVLYVLSRPDDVGFLDPRASAIPLANALDALGDAVDLQVLSGGSFEGLRQALTEAAASKRPFHVVHFDGHGTYDRDTHQGALVFEDDVFTAGGARYRPVQLVSATELGEVLSGLRVPLFFLEACQTAKTEEKPQASVAAALLRAGVRSVVAMSHSVLVSTARQLVEVFYKGLVCGAPIGAALAEARRALRERRGRTERPDGTTLELGDWLIPVLFQAGDADPVLVPASHVAPTVTTRENSAKQAIGRLPDPPPHTFVGRGHELVDLDRMLTPGRGLVLVGPGGLGKTALAVETARWLLAMRRIDRVAFVSVETVSDSRGVLSAVGEQLVPGYTIAVEEGSGSDEQKRENALLRIENALRSSRTLLVVDNLESLLPAPGASPSEDVNALFAMLRHLVSTGDTRVLLTSRESLPGGLWPDAGEVPIGALRTSDAVNLLSAVLRQKDKSPLDETEMEQIEALIQAVGGHARSLVLLGEEVGRSGVVKTTEDVRAVMRSLEKRHSEARERSLIASVRLSLRRLPIEVQRQIRPLAVFHGPAHVIAIAHVLEIEPDAALDLCRQLVAVGLAAAEGPYLLPDPALGAALADELTSGERRNAEARWLDEMEAFVGFLYDQQFRDAQVALQGARQTLADALAALQRIASDVESDSRAAGRAIDFVTSLESLVSSLGLPRALLQVSALRQTLTERLPAWSHARYLIESAEAERLLETGNLPAALRAAFALRDQAEKAGDVYPEAGYDRAMAQIKVGRALQRGGAAAEALSALRDAERRFAVLAAAGGRDAAQMESASMTEQGNALRSLGQLDDAAAAYERGIQSAKGLGDPRSVAVGNAELGTLRMLQGRLDDALIAHERAREGFEKLGEVAMQAVAWHQIGMVHEDAKQFDAAEAAYRQSLALKIAQGNKAGEALTLGQLGLLYDAQGRIEEATVYCQQAASAYQTLGDKYGEGRQRSNLGIRLHKLRRFDEARAALNVAIALKEPFGHAAEPWKAWTVLAEVERDAGRPADALEARERAMAIYRAYRADGGEPMDSATRLIAGVRQLLGDEGAEAAQALLARVEFVVELVPLREALVALASGEDAPVRALIADPAFSPTFAVELSLLLDSVPRSARQNREGA